MNVLKNYAESEIVVKNSRFIAELFPVSNQAAARELLKEQKQKYFDARHVVHAFVIGKQAEILGMSDDGEPSGTAGRPVLDILKGQNCTNCMITITRYFGGILLGTGGLVKAYGDAARAVIAKMEVEELVEKTSFSFSVPYDSYDMIKYHLQHFHIDSLQEEFTDSVRLIGNVFAVEFSQLQQKINDLTNGKVVVTENAE